MEERKSNNYTIAMVILLILQVVTISLTFAYAYLGRYDHNKASNIWSVMWHGFLPMVGIVSSVLSLVAGIIGMKENKVLGILLIISFFVSAFSGIVAIGSHF